MVLISRWIARIHSDIGRTCCVMMEDKAGNNKRTMVELGLASTIISSTLRFFRGGIENTTHGVLRVLNFGCKKTVPKVTNELLLQPAGILAAKIRRGELSSEAVTRAYIDRMMEVNGLINAIVDTRYADAIQEARMVDQIVASGSLSESEMAEEFPLLGIPFTAKEALLIKGMSSTCGLVCRKGLTAAEDCEPVQRLRGCGAIPVALTNTSEICMYWETYNKLHGRTNNPYDTTRTVGGSSGGEAAILSSAGSIIGLGTDLGGSIRIPAFFNGIFGHKPTQGFVPTGGQFPPALEEVQPYVVVGPMVRYATDIKLVLSALVGKEATRTLNLFTPVDLRSIKVYYILDDGAPVTMPVATDIQEGIKKVADMLSMEGLVVEKANLKYTKLGFIIWCAYLSKVKNQRISNIMKGEMKTEDYNDSAHQEMWKWLSGKSDHTFPIILNACAQDYLAPLMRKPLDFFIQCGEKMKQELLDLLQHKSAVLLYPTFPHVASHHGQILANPFNTSYTVMLNAAGLPATQCPLGFDSSNLPFGMQIITGPYNDRLSIALAEHLEEKLGGWVQPS